jgi:tRNA1Val (adenine37-N6)-methyltransferase
MDSNPSRILDIGTGTGLIALMMAQRSQAKVIDAIEIAEDAYVQSVENFEGSDWGDRLFCYHASLQEFVEEMDERYDLLISNPPFYNATYKELPENRARARHTKSLSYKELLECVARLLSENGNCAFIIPFREEERFIKIARQYSLYPHRITRVKGALNTQIKRSLLQLSFFEKSTETTELIIELERHVYTEDYIDLVKDFYLKL